MGHGDVVNLIKESGLQVRLTIGNPRETSSSSSNIYQTTGSANIMQPITNNPNSNPNNNGNSRNDGYINGNTRYPIMS